MDFVFAYIDPGSGSLIVQALIAGLVALPIFFRAQVRRAIQMLRGSDGASSPGPTGQDEGNNGA